MKSQESFNSRMLRDALGKFATGVTVITGYSEQYGQFGVTVNSFNSVSLSPPLVLWSIANDSGTRLAFQTAKHFAIHILAENQVEMSRNFSSAQEDRLSHIKFQANEYRVPILEDCAACFECRPYNRQEAGDHEVYIGEVTALSINPRSRPLVYYSGNYSRIEG